jgi:hypothetical protein
MNCNRIREVTENLLNCGDDIGTMKRSVDQLYDLFSKITGVNSDDLNEEHLFLSSGQAINPSSAALCLIDFKRTALFLRGIDKAIMQKISLQNERKIHILYAGTGPYATLILPLLTLFSPGKIQVDLLDVNSKSLNAAIKLFGSLQLDLFIGNSYNQDASKFTIEKEYDIVISETMQAALKKEPQVAIMQNLIPQLPPDAIFIPERITIAAGLVSNRKWDDENGYYLGAEELIREELFSVDKRNLKTECFKKSIIVPHAVGNCRNLMLFTTIEVFDNEILYDNDCSLTSPWKVFEIKDDIVETIHFWYETGALPGVKCRFDGETEVIDTSKRMRTNALRKS